ncbi:hypothetical protein SAY87_019072 [Trapa incisa]|uniref:Uncharacterized protein n=1 Tax=Trapa incisa TaxID=236973 RepID=A0AAN7Q1D0_9MYRT|nr:hypothetical protein SAY87_019072 [Trapa incisa]
MIGEANSWTASLKRERDAVGNEPAHRKQLWCVFSTLLPIAYLSHPYHPSGNSDPVGKKNTSMGGEAYKAKAAATSRGLHNNPTALHTAAVILPKEGGYYMLYEDKRMWIFRAILTSIRAVIFESWVWQRCG